MARLYYDKRIATLAAATTEAAGYPASNVLLESLGRPYRSTSAAATDLTITFPANVALHSWFLDDVNFAACDVEKSANGVIFVPVGTLTTYADKLRRRRGRITVNDPSVKALRARMSGVLSDGLSYWRIGASYPLGSSLAISAPFQSGYSAQAHYPQSRRTLPNGKDAVAEAGIAFHDIVLPFKPLDSEDLEPVVRHARAGTALLDLELSNYPAQLWPVRLIEPTMGEEYPSPKVSDLTFTFREVV